MRGTKTPPPSPTHHLRILPILPRSARRYPAFLVDRIDVPDKFAIAPLQSHTAEIRRAELELRHVGQRPGDIVLVLVEDSGIGIDPKDIERIFDSFFTTKSQGMGMGLSICRSIIEAHNGKLCASSGTGQRSIFNIQLPAFKAGVACA